VQITLGLYSFVCGDVISIHAVDVVFQKSWTFVSGMHETRLVFNLLFDQFKQAPCFLSL